MHTSRDLERAFTLIELLVVITIIAVLAALIFPALQGAQERGREVKCAGNLGQLMTGFINFAADNEGRLPGNKQERGHPDVRRRDWLFGSTGNYLKAPQEGTLFPYVGRDAKLYRCPSAVPGKPGTGIGSNGRFDYSAYGSLAGARLASINSHSRFADAKGEFTMLPTPVLVEEDYISYINKNPYMEGAHSYPDKMNRIHRGGGYYASITGSVHWFLEPGYANSLSWTSQTPSGSWIPLGNDYKEDQWKDN